MNPNSPPILETASQQLDQAKTELKAAARDLQEYTFAQKTAFVAKMQAQVAELNRDLEHISATIEKSSAAIKAEAQPRHQALHEQTAQLHRQIDAAITATEASWDHVMTGSRKTCEDLKNGLHHARQWVSDKIAP